MTDITQIQNFIEFNQPIFDEIKSSDEKLSDALVNVVEELFKKYIGVSIPKTKDPVVNTQFSNMSLSELQEEKETQMELIELYDDPNDPDQIEAEDKLLEIDLEINSRN